MIYYYSAEGNSRHVAMTLARMLGQTAADILHVGTAALDTDTIGLVFPVHCWGVPPAVCRFIESLNPGDRKIRVWAVMTCGDDTGLAHRMLRRKLRQRGLILHSVFSVQMPNTYLLIKGFRLDSPEVVQSKLRRCEVRCKDIAGAIRDGRPATDVHTGSFAWFKTAVIYPLFFRRRISPGRWKVNTGLCVECGKCAAVCPVGNIAMENGRPVWSDKCVQCLSCYHNCPQRAIDCLPYTRGRGQYVSVSVKPRSLPQGIS